MERMEAACTRLERALSRLEGAFDAVIERGDTDSPSAQERILLLEDRARLSDELDAALARQEELQGLADEASIALESVIAEVRGSLQKKDDAVGEG